MGYIDEHGIRAVCFDIDGTLYPPRITNRNLVKASLFHLPFALKYMKMRKTVRREDGYEALPVSSHEDFLRRSWRIMYPDGRRSFEWFCAKLDRVFTSRWEKDFADLVGFEGMPETLRALKSKVRIGVMSDFPIGVKLKAMGIEDIPDFVCSTENYGHLKPSKTCFDMLSKGIGVSPGNILYVGDSEIKDVLGARNAGMHALLIADGKRKIGSKADLVVGNYMEMAKALL